MSHGRKEFMLRTFGESIVLLFETLKFSSTSFYSMLSLTHTGIEFAQYARAIQFGLGTRYKFMRIRNDINFDSIRFNYQLRGTLHDNPYTSETFCRQLVLTAPNYIMHIHKVDKARYKNTRHRTGRYEMTLKFIPRRNRLQCNMAYAKYNFLFSKNRTCADRMYAFLRVLYIVPQRSWGYMLGVRAARKCMEDEEL